MYPLLLNKRIAVGEEHSRVAVDRHRITQMFSMLCVLISGASLAAPISTNTALPLSADEIIVREQFIMTRSSDHLSGTRREVDRFELRTVLGFGATSKLALFGVLPLVYVDREFGASVRLNPALAIPRCSHAMRCIVPTGQDARYASRPMPGSDYPRDETAKPVMVQSMCSAA